MKKKVLFCVSSLGLGHATRTLVVIKSFLETHQVYILATGNALKFLKKELKKKGIIFFDYPDYPAIERGKGFEFYYYLLIDLIEIQRLIKKENKYIQKIVTKYNINIIFSDGRYGAYSNKIPSFLLSHQISFIMPKGLSFFQRISDYFNYVSFRKFSHILVPDYPNKNNLSGELSHSKVLNKLPHTYIGIISSIPYVKKEEDIDYLILISGYLLEHKQEFINNILEESRKLKGKKVVVYGDVSDNIHYFDKKHNIEVYSHISGNLRNQLFNRAKFIVSRAGYTTIMDLVEHKKPAFLIPTPNQTEQEYLAKYLKKYYSINFSQKKINFKNINKNIKLFEPKWKTETSVKKIKNIIEKYT